MKQSTASEGIVQVHDDLQHQGELMSSPQDNKPKIVILGGGMAALTAAFELTSSDGWKNDYDVHVYQMGWRLGGKGASGRNADVHQRIEEHGLHVWPGFYDHAFQLMQRCYAELGRGANEPLATWEQAFIPQDFVVVEELIDGGWIHWPFTAPRNDATPGTPGELPTIWDYISMTVQLMRQWLESAELAPESKTEIAIPPIPELSLWGRLRRTAERVLRWIGLRGLADSLARQRVHQVMRKLVGPAVSDAERMLDVAQRLTDSIPKIAAQQTALQRDSLMWTLDRFVDDFRDRFESEIADNDTLRRLYIQLDFARAAIRGTIADLVFARGFEAIDKYDFRRWLKRHGASQLTLESGLIRGLYDFVFASVAGDPRRPDLAAGVALRLIARMSLTYKQSIMWEMKSGMGDVVFAPLYHVLERRGVQFHFFHRVKSLELAASGNSVARVKLARQATVKRDPTSGKREYDPLIDVMGLPCWPNAPKYRALEEGDQLEQGNVDLESAWTDWQDIEEVSLPIGSGDKVVLGTSLAAVSHICSELIRANRNWRRMIDNLRTVQTQAVQLWMFPTLAELGWTMDSPIMTAYEKPLETWADMTQTVSSEPWPNHLRPGSVAYFCGTLPDAAEIPEPGPSDFPQRQRARVHQEAIRWLSSHAGHLWPNGTPPGSQELDWQKLIDPGNATGVDRFDSQYWRANVNPTDRYVLSIAGSTKFRLDPADSGFDNLYLAGDWTRNELNVGCIEAAVTSGLRAARGIPRA